MGMSCLANTIPPFTCLFITSLTCISVFWAKMGEMKRTRLLRNSPHPAVLSLVLPVGSDHTHFLAMGWDALRAYRWMLGGGGAFEIPYGSRHVARCEQRTDTSMIIRVCIVWWVEQQLESGCRRRFIFGLMIGNIDTMFQQGYNISLSFPSFWLSDSQKKPDSVKSMKW